MRDWNAADCARCLVPREGDCNKGNFGYIALIGGSLRYSGAAKLANLAAVAMRSGAGVVKLAVPREIAFAVAPFLLESTLFPLASNDGELAFDAKLVDELMRNVNAAAFGMGCGAGCGTQQTLEYLLENFRGALAIDADGLNCLAQMGVQLLDKCAPRVILTPHVKEFSRLAGVPVQTVIERGAELAKRFASAHRVILLLKGATTTVTDGEEVLLVRRGCAGMATAGSGDVLSGVIAALCGYNTDLLQATATAAYINGVAGELAEQQSNSISMTAGDTARHITTAVNAILKG